MLAVLLALVAAILFGALTAAVRSAYARVPDPQVAALASTGVAFVVATVIALLDPGRAGGARDLGAFALAGVLVPGGGQLLFVYGIAYAGAARASIVIGAAPLVAVVVAVLALDEPLHGPVVAGAVLIVLGGAALVGERRRPVGFRAVGLAFAFACAVLVALRDNAVRWLAGDTGASPLAASAAALAGGTAFIALFLLATRRGGWLAALDRGRALVPFLPAGLLYGLSYAALFDAYYRGRVTVVSPVVATESLWGVLFAALVVGRSELVGRRVVAGALLVVAGAGLIGVFR